MKKKTIIIKKKDLYGSLSIITIILVFVIIYSIRFYKSKELQKSNTYSVCVISGFGDAHVYYKFRFMYKELSGTTSLSYKLGKSLPFPSINDRYIVKIVKYYPDISEIQFEHKISNCEIDIPECGWEGIPDISKICD